MNQDENNMANILFAIEIDASASEVRKAITEESGVKGWWTTDTTLKQEVGSEAVFGFGPRGTLKFEVAELGDNHIEWKSTQAGPPDWAGTNVTFDLEAQDGHTNLLFGHRNFATDEGSYAFTSWNWAYFLMSLKSYIETGQGTPVGA